MLVVFGVTAALVSYAPPIDAASGPFSINTTLGQAELELTVEPARVGLNTVHMYLIDAKTGAQFTATKELTVTAKLPAKGIGPLPLQSNLAGPGHYVLSSADLSPGGTWQVQHPRPRVGIRRVRKDRVGPNPMRTFGHDCLKRSRARYRVAVQRGPIHSKEEHMKRIAVSALAIGVLVLPAAAQAHISLHPNTIPAGAFVTLDVRVPG